MILYDVGHKVRSKGTSDVVCSVCVSFIGRGWGYNQSYFPPLTLFREKTLGFVERLKPSTKKLLTRDRNRNYSELSGKVNGLCWWDWLHISFDSITFIEIQVYNNSKNVICVGNTLSYLLCDSKIKISAILCHKTLGNVRNQLNHMFKVTIKRDKNSLIQNKLYKNSKLFYEIYI